MVVYTILYYIFNSWYALTDIVMVDELKLGPIEVDNLLIYIGKVHVYQEEVEKIHFNSCYKVTSIMMIVYSTFQY